MYNSKAFKKWRNEICIVNETCKNCINFEECKGGCPMRTLSFREKIDSNIHYDICSCAWYNYLNDLNLDKNFKGWSYV
jgi:radical SAM protein with 4Fe4S-binding SPASM domain